MALAEVLRVLQVSFAASGCLRCTAEPTSCREQDCTRGDDCCVSSGQRASSWTTDEMSPTQQATLLHPELVSLRQMCSGVLVLYGEY